MTASVADVMTAITEVAVNGGLVDRAYDWPTLDVNPPCLVAGYPDLSFDLTMRRGADRATYPVWIVCGVADKRSSRDVLSPFIVGGGVSVKGILQGTLNGTVQSARVTTCQIETVNIGGLDYVAARFDLDVVN